MPTASALAVFFFFLRSVPAGFANTDDAFYGVDDDKLREPPRYLGVCHRRDKDINKCIKSSVEKFLETVNAGAEEHNLPNIDPLEIPHVEFHQGSGNVSLDITFTDFTIAGFKHFKIMSVRSNLDDNKFEISMDTPFVNMMARYSAAGGVYTFPIAGEGDFSLNLTDVSAVLIIRLATTEVASSLRIFTVENCLVDLLPGDISAHFGEHIDGSNAIGAAFNTFFNNNAHEIFTVVKPKISGILANIIADIANEVLGRYPHDMLLPD